MYHNCSNYSLSINIWIKVWCGEIVMNWLHKNIFFYLFLFWQSWNETFNFHVIKAGSVTSCWTKISGIKQTFSGYDWDLVIQSHNFESPVCRHWSPWQFGDGGNHQINIDQGWKQDIYLGFQTVHEIWGANQKITVKLHTLCEILKKFETPHRTPLP